MVRRIFTIIFLTAALYGCSHLDLKGILMPTGEGVEARFKQSMAISQDLSAGTVDVNETYYVYVAADPHIDQTHKNLTSFNYDLRNDNIAGFGVILGDCTDKRDNLPSYLDALSYSPDLHECNKEIFHILGNHDLFFNGWENFKDSIGPSVYWFEAAFEGGKDLYISLDTATGTLGRNQTEWLKSFLSESRSQYRHCVILTHTNFFYTDTSQASSGNMTIDESYSLLDLFGKHNVSLVLQGHDHYREDLTYDNVRYTVLGAISDKLKPAEYLKMKVNSDGISFDWILML